MQAASDVFKKDTHPALPEEAAATSPLPAREILVGIVATVARLAAPR